MLRNAILIVIFCFLLSVFNANAQSENKVETPQLYHYPLRTIGYISLGVGVLSFAGGLYANHEVSKYNNAASSDDNNYYHANTNFDTSWNQVQNDMNHAHNNVNLRNALYITSGATVGFGIVSIFFIKKPIEDKVSIEMSPNKINLAYKF